MFRRPKDPHNALTIVAVVSILIEMEHIEKISHSWRVERHVGVAGIDNWVFQIVAAAAGQRFQVPVPLDELHDRCMIAIRMADVPAFREGRNDD